MSTADINTRELPFSGQEIAKLFIATAEAHNGIAAFTDQTTLSVWFANAVMRGYDQRAREVGGGTDETFATFEQLVEGEDSLFDHEPIMKFFRYVHLPAHLQSISRPFANMAARAIQQCKASAERTEGLRKLLEAKDCIVRAYL